MILTERPSTASGVNNNTEATSTSPGLRITNWLTFSQKRELAAANGRMVGWSDRRTFDVDEVGSSRDGQNTQLRAACKR